MKCYYIDIIFTLLLVRAIVRCKAKDTQFVNPPDVRNHININLLPKDCGLVQPQKRIVGGSPANLFEFPWIALLAFDVEGEIRYDCGGTVINKRYILTSANCASQKELKTVRLGEYNITSDRECRYTTIASVICAPPVQDISIDKVIVHPDYTNVTKTYDIALLRLSSDITFNDAVSPVCLPLTPIAISDSLTAIGWGLTNFFDSESRSNILLKVNVPYINEKSCRSVSVYKDHTLAIERGICAGKTGKDTCIGDTGGPLLSLNIADNDIKYVQIGITSFGIACGIPPGVYTNVALYMKWILDNLQ